MRVGIYRCRMLGRYWQINKSLKVDMAMFTSVISAAACREIETEQRRL